MLLNFCENTQMCKPTSEQVRGDIVAEMCLALWPDGPIIAQMRRLRVAAKLAWT